MSDLTPGSPAAPPPGPIDDGTNPDGIGGTGYDMAALGEYLDADCSPPNPVIDENPECQAVLDALQRMRAMSQDLVDDEARALAMPAAWITRVIEGLETDLRAGRDIPVTDSDPLTVITISEGAVRELVRTAGDSVDGVIVGRVVLDGDVRGGEPIAVTVRISAALVEPLTALAGRVRDAVTTTLLTHTELPVASIDIVVDDVHPVLARMEEDS